MLNACSPCPCLRSNEPAHLGSEFAIIGLCIGAGIAGVYTEVRNNLNTVPACASCRALTRVRPCCAQDVKVMLTIFLGGMVSVHVTRPSPYSSHSLRLQHCSIQTCLLTSGVHTLPSYAYAGYLDYDGLPCFAAQGEGKAAGQVRHTQTHTCTVKAKLQARCVRCFITRTNNSCMETGWRCALLSLLAVADQCTRLRIHVCR